MSLIPYDEVCRKLDTYYNCDFYVGDQMYVTGSQLDSLVHAGWLVQVIGAGSSSMSRFDPGFIVELMERKDKVFRTEHFVSLNTDLCYLEYYYSSILGW